MSIGKRNTRDLSEERYRCSKNFITEENGRESYSDWESKDL